MVRGTWTEEGSPGSDSLFTLGGTSDGVDGSAAARNAWNLGPSCAPAFCPALLVYLLMLV